MPHLFEIESSNVRKAIDSCLEGENSARLAIDIDPDEIWKIPTHHTSAGRILAHLPQTENGRQKLFVFCPLTIFLSTEPKNKLVKELKRICKEEEKPNSRFLNHNVMFVSAEFFVMPNKQSAVVEWKKGMALWREDSTQCVLEDVFSFEDSHLPCWYKAKETIEIPDFYEYQTIRFSEEVKKAVAPKYFKTTGTDYINKLLDKRATAEKNYYEYGEYLKEMFLFL